MQALTAIVFSLVIVMIQFSAIAYSPFLVIWTTRDRVLNSSVAKGRHVCRFGRHSCSFGRGEHIANLGLYLQSGRPRDFPS
jgi:hypothetical protein